MNETIVLTGISVTLFYFDNLMDEIDDENFKFRGKSSIRCFAINFNFDASRTCNAYQNEAVRIRFQFAILCPAVI